MDAWWNPLSIVTPTYRRPQHSKRPVIRCQKVYVMGSLRPSNRYKYPWSAAPQRRTSSHRRPPHHTSPAHRSSRRPYSRSHTRPPTELFNPRTATARLFGFPISLRTLRMVAPMPRIVLRTAQLAFALAVVLNYSVDLVRESKVEKYNFTHWVSLSSLRLCLIPYAHSKSYTINVS